MPGIESNPWSKVGKVCWYCNKLVKNPSITLQENSIVLNFYSKSKGYVPSCPRHEEHDFHFCSFECYMKFMFKLVMIEASKYNNNGEFHKAMLSFAKYIF